MSSPRSVRVALGLCAVLFAGACRADTSVPAPPATPADGSSPTTAQDPVAVSVVHVTDGDTIEVSQDGEVATVRLIGINAPEQGECFAEEAQAGLAELIAGRDIRLVTDTSDTDRYGRLLRYVHVGPTDVNRQMVDRGLALARRYPPDTARADELDAAQDDAQRSGRGMWSPESGCVAPPGTGQGLELAVNADAPGDDGRNLNGEWVEIRNVGTRRHDLSGWGLKDESASHRYTFPAGSDVGPGQTLVVRSGCGDDRPLELHWCAQRSAIWNNDGDTAFLLDPEGRVVLQHRY